MFIWEYTIALHEIQGNQASSPSEAYVSWDFPSCGRIVGYILELQRVWQFETHFIYKNLNFHNNLGGRSFYPQRQRWKLGEIKSLPQCCSSH